MAGARGCFNCGGCCVLSQGGHADLLQLFVRSLWRIIPIAERYILPGGLEGHVSRDCTSEAKAKSCFKCGKEGHLSRECPDNTATGGFSSYSGGSGGQECYRCGKPGHIARACPEAASGNFGAFGGGGSQKTWQLLLRRCRAPFAGLCGAHLEGMPAASKEGVLHLRF
ncbi:hypothetical protein IEO21_01903 [Rhodonia placenta]|uniref:CCHC-type domain-containing protein n=1 Tax=Rhodonia placenta TaxID=104341 RepID=A0A8H7P8Z7_9APHY|nr:hypothetical protein IEO21_01903 [Postia placenta]